MNQERILSSALVGGGAGAALWLLHGVSKVLGIPRLLIYTGLGTAVAYLVDELTTPREE